LLIKHQILKQRKAANDSKKAKKMMKATMKIINKKEFNKYHYKS